MSIKKILSGVVILTGVYFIGRGAAPDLGEVLDYVKTNPRHQELILNNTINERERLNLEYSNETLGNFSRVLLSEFNRKGIRGEKERATSKLVKQDNLGASSSDINLSQIKDYLYDRAMELLE